MRPHIIGRWMLGLFLLGAALSPAHAAALTVDQMAVGTAIDNRALEGAADTFGADIPRLYCWTHVTAAVPPTTLKHVWLLNGQKEAEVSLPINYPAMRTWSSKTPAPGTWVVEATDAAGVILSSVTFTVH